MNAFDRLAGLAYSSWYRSSPSTAIAGIDDLGDRECLAVLCRDGPSFQARPRVHTSYINDTGKKQSLLLNMGRSPWNLPSKCMKRNEYAKCSTKVAPHSLMTRLLVWIRHWHDRVRSTQDMLKDSLQQHHIRETSPPPPSYTHKLGPFLAGCAAARPRLSGANTRVGG